MAKPSKKVKKLITNRKPKTVKKLPVLVRTIETDPIKKSKITIDDTRPKCYICGRPIKDISTAIVIDCRTPKIYRHQKCAYEIGRRYMESLGLKYEVDKMIDKDADD